MMKETQAQPHVQEQRRSALDEIARAAAPRALQMEVGSGKLISTDTVADRDRHLGRDCRTYEERNRHMCEWTRE